MLALALLATGASAQGACNTGAGWTCTTVYDGDGLSSPPDIPIGVAIQYVPADGDAYFAIERKNADDDDGSTTTNRLKGLVKSCDNAACTTTSTVTALTSIGGSRTEGGGAYAPTMVGERNSGNTRMHVVGSVDDTGCAPGEPRLREHVLEADLTQVTALTVDDGRCDVTYGSPVILYDGIYSSMFMCWTDKEVSPSTEQVLCSGRSLGSSWVGPPHDDHPDGTDSSEHAAIGLTAAGDPKVAWANKTDGTVEFGVADGTSYAAIPDVSASPNWPAMQRVGDNWRLYFVDIVSGDGKIYSSTCSTACETASNWSSSPTLEITIPDLTTLLHLEYLRASDGSRHLLWQQQPDTGTKREVYYATQCAGDVNWTITRPYTDSGTWKQVLSLGRPHLALDEANHVAHVAFGDLADTSDPDDGDIIWARRSWTECT